MKQWPLICVATVLLAACSSNNYEQPQQNTLQPVVCAGPMVEISGAEPRPEALAAAINQDYENNGQRYTIVQNPAEFSQTGLAAVYDAEPMGNLTASGETFDPGALTAAHPTLPVPSYARITNLSNGRMLVVRINDRGPYGNDRVISLTRASADRLNTSDNTKVRIDPIIVEADGNLSGPGMACTTIAKQSYALPARPDLSTGSDSMPSTSNSTISESDVMPISNTSLTHENASDMQVDSNNALQAPTLLTSGTTETQEHLINQHNNAPVQNEETSSLIASPLASVSDSSKQYMVQVGAISDSTRAQQWQQTLSQQLNVPGKTSSNGVLFRVQLGPFPTRSQAEAFQQQLPGEMLQQSFIIQNADK